MTELEFLQRVKANLPFAGFICHAINEVYTADAYHWRKKYLDLVKQGIGSSPLYGWLVDQEVFLDPTADQMDLAREAWVDRWIENLKEQNDRT